MFNLFRREIHKIIAKYVQHYVQYSILALFAVLILSMGVYYRVYESNISMYDRIMFFNFVYYFLLIRMIANGMATPYNECTFEKDDNKLIYNITISKYSSQMILLVRIIIKSIISTTITLISIVCISILFGVFFSYINYLMLIMQVILGNCILFGISFAFSALCNYFDIEKQIAIMFELALIMYFVLAPLNHIFNVINIIKNNIYSILYAEIVDANIVVLEGSQNALALAMSIITLILGISIYSFMNYLRLRKKWRVYDEKMES